MVSTDTIVVGDGTGSAATDIVGVRGTRSFLDVRDQSLETAVGEDTSDHFLGAKITLDD